MHHPIRGNMDCGMREMFACGIRNSALGVQNPSDNQNLESSTWNRNSQPEIPVYKAVLENLTWGKMNSDFRVEYIRAS